MGASLLVPLALSALSAGAGYYNNQKTLEDQNDATTAGLMRQSQLQDQANAQVGQEITRLGTSTPDAARKAANANFMATLQRGRAAAAASTPQVAGADPRYAQAVSAGQTTNNAAESAQAHLMGQIEAPQLQHQQEGFGIQDLGNTLSQIAGASQGQDFLTQLRVRSAQNNPWLSALSQLAGSAADGLSKRMPPATPKTYDMSTMYDTTTPINTREYV